MTSCAAGAHDVRTLGHMALYSLCHEAGVCTARRVKNLRTDGGGKYHNTVMKVAKDRLGVEEQYIPPNCHQSNGLVERLNYTLTCTIRTVRKQANLPPQLWGEAALYAAHVYNLTPHSKLMKRRTLSLSG
jgi:hypothetical protein